jgi:hypothetical protein
VVPLCTCNRSEHVIDLLEALQRSNDVVVDATSCELRLASMARGDQADALTNWSNSFGSDDIGVPASTRT